MESERKQKPYPYKAAEFTTEELEKMKSMASLREYNVFHDCNHIIYSLTVQLIKERAANEKP
jgi:hypothetical protein|tara:strand:+ start:271 stop:456 length:186 start_codon:yes stop_codon:yes gene_type:complete